MKELKIKKGRPLLNYVILTADRYTTEELAAFNGGIVRADMQDQIKPYQTILAISPRITHSPLEVGQLVLINLDRYARSTQKKDSVTSSMDENYNIHVRYEVPIIELDGEECLKLGDNDIEFIIDQHEFVTTDKTNLDVGKSNIITPKGGIVLPN